WRSTACSPTSPWTSSKRSPPPSSADPRRPRPSVASCNPPWQFARHPDAFLAVDQGLVRACLLLSATLMDSVREDVEDDAGATTVADEAVAARRSAKHPGLKLWIAAILVAIVAIVGLMRPWKRSGEAQAIAPTPPPAARPVIRLSAAALAK